MLLFTQAKWLGARVQVQASYYGAKVPGKAGTLLGSSFGLARLERSLEAKLEIRMKPL